jgi:two-component system sensor histidine kinase DegS
MKAARLERIPTAHEGIASAREVERRRLARELHDGPAQALAAALFGVDLAIAAFRRDPGTAREELVGARELVRDALDDVRSLMAGLRPRLLEERGLVTALQTLAAMPPLWGPEVRFAAHGIAAGRRLPPEIELGLYRIAQEAVSNARRHSGATWISVTLEVERGAVALDVRDDGHGFATKVTPLQPGYGEGLPGMRERAALLGGDLKIESAADAGTRITVVIPLPPRRGDVKGEGKA